MGIDVWKKLFSCAMSQIKQENIPKNSWSFGGGTVLMHKFNHRMSKDIDIFFLDKQLFSYVSPRVNDALEDIMIDFVEQDNFTKIYLQDGEIDFIFSPQISKCKPSLTTIEGKSIYVDSPVEIVAKKIEYRAEEFKARDIFDLSIVYFNLRNSLLKNIFLNQDKISSLKLRIDQIEKSEILEIELNNIYKLPGADKIKGKEFALCKDFIASMEKQFEFDKKFSRVRDTGLLR